MPTWKAIPSKGLKGRKDDGIFSTFECELSWAAFPETISPKCRDYVSRRFPLWSPLIRYARDDVGNSMLSQHSISAFQAFRDFLRGVPEVSRVYPNNHPGRLAFSTASVGGKRRIFAIGNYVVQRVLRPLHDFLMKVLRSIPMDGTFNQVRPLDRLAGHSDVYSIDLKSATDRWPLSLQTLLVKHLFGPEFETCLYDVFRLGTFKVPFLK